MEINEAFRRIVVGHRWLLMTCALLPIVAVAAVLTFSPVRYIASARVQASSADVGTDIQADSVVNRVRGIATSPAVVGEAMRKAGVHGRSARDVGTHDITVTELGSSPVLDLSVSDANPRVAQDLTNSLARIVVDALGGQQDARKRQLASQVRSQQQQLYQQRKSLLTSLAHSGSAARIASLSAQLSTVDQQLADIASTLRQLALPDATDGSAMFISPAQEALSAKPNVVTDFALALMAGLVAGLLAASLIEIARPKVANVSTLARDLGVPFLGDIAVSPGAGADARVSQPTESLVALTGAAARCRAETIVVVGCGEHAGAEATMLAVSRSLRDAFAATPAQNGYSGSGLSAHQPWQTSPPRSEAPEAERAQPVSLLETEDRMSAAPPTVVDVRALTTSWGTGQVRGGRHALVVLASAPLPQRDIDRVVSLSSATGWPVLGVLALTVREDERPTSHPRQAPDVPADRGERAGDQA
jgi:capsular polysaccharide biosynthesis protein